MKNCNHADGIPLARVPHFISSSYSSSFFQCLFFLFCSSSLRISFCMFFLCFSPRFCPLYLSLWSLRLRSRSVTQEGSGHTCVITTEKVHATANQTNCTHASFVFHRNVVGTSHIGLVEDSCVQPDRLQPTLPPDPEVSPNPERKTCR